MWNDLTMQQRADVISMAVKAGMRDMKSIRSFYDETLGSRRFDDGGDINEERPPIIPFSQREEVIITPDQEYNKYLNTLPDNQRFTPNEEYDSYLYWRLHGKPKDFKEAYDRGMFNYDHSDNSYHGNSIAYDDNGIGYFIKPKTHDTVKYELDWYNKSLVTEEGGQQRPMNKEEQVLHDDFKSNYDLIDDPDRPNYYRYQPKEKAFGGHLYAGGGGIKKYVGDLEDIGYDADNMKFYEKATGKELGDSAILDEVIVNGRNRANDYLTEANDNTSVYNVPHREYNQHLKDRAEQGAREAAIWREEHPNLSAWGEAAASIPLAVASVPLIAGGAEALAGTSAGQAMSSGLLSLSNLAKGSTIAGAPTWAWADAGLTSVFGAHGVKEMANGNFTPITALEILPFAQVVKPAVKMTTQGAKEFVDNGTLWDAYTTFGGRFGNYGDNIFTKIYGTAARRFGLPDKARIPADAMRKIKGDIHIDNGVIDLTGNKPYLGNPHVNMTLDRGVVSHSKGQWDGADTYVVPTNNFIEQSSEALKSIEPSDMFSNGAKVTEIPKNVTLISGDIEALNKAKEVGIQTLSSPKLRRIYEDGMREYKVEKATFDEQYANTKGLQRRLLKAPESPKYRRWWPEYAEEMQRLQTRRGTPTLADFKLLEQQTGLKSGVAPLLERDKAIKQLGAMRNAYVLDIMSGKVQPYVYPNGRIVDWDKAAEELELIQRAKYNNVFYDPASHVESEWQAANGVR